MPKATAKDVTMVLTFVGNGTNATKAVNTANDDMNQWVDDCDPDPVITHMHTTMTVLPETETSTAWYVFTITVTTGPA